MPDDPPLADSLSKPGLPQGPDSKPAWPGWRTRLMHVWASSLGAITTRRPPERLSLMPLDPWPGDPAAGERLVRDWSTGTIRWDADLISAESANILESTGSPPLDSMHDFNWLRDLRALGGKDARACARELTDDWLTRHARWSSKAGDVWRADILAARQIAWLSQFELFYAQASESLHRRVLVALTRQHRHLGWTAAREVEGLPRISALKGLVYGCLCLDLGRRSRSDLARTLRLLEGELKAQINPDGGVRDRNPANQVTLIRHLVDIRATLNASGRETTRTIPKDIRASLNAALRHATPMVRMLRHGDGKLAHFNGGVESDPGLIDLVLAQANIRVRTPRRAADSGYERLGGGRCLVLVDTGSPAQQNGHAGAASLELSFGRERLVVNCGDSRTADPAWRRAGKATAAHSTLSVADTNSSEIQNDGGRGGRIASVTCERNDADGDSWLTVAHDGYKAPFGLTHRRRLYVSASGEDVRGEDALLQNGQADNLETQPECPYTIRFHLHPAVAASLSRDGEAVLLRPPSGVGWRFRAAGAALELAESIYLTDATPKRTQQIVLSGITGARTTGAAATGTETVVKWSLRREGAG